MVRALARRLPEPVKDFIKRLPRRVGYRWGPMLMSELRKRWVIRRHPGATIRFHGRVYLGPGFSLHMPGRGSFIAGPNVEFRRNFRAELGEGARIVIGEGCVLGYDVILGCSTAIELGKHVILGPHVYLSDGSHDYGGDIKKAFLERGYQFQSIRLDDHAAVGTKCTVTASMGERAMASSNSVVNRAVPAFCAVGGVPARLGRYFGPPDEEPDEVRRERLVWEEDRRVRRDRVARAGDGSRGDADGGDDGQGAERAAAAQPADQS